MNLCTNAVHAMRDKKGVLDVGLTNMDIDAVNGGNYMAMPSGPCVRLSVSATG
ncbi:MAG: hypothetical protein QGG48_00910 [Desulfatiglandales bacterium]|jgi:hypothetical protein|nr:hypothetical protein [Desulfatiglandales bacterium]